MLTEEILEELRNTRNIALCTPKPNEDFLKLMDGLLENNNETAREFENFLSEPELPLHHEKCGALHANDSDNYQIKEE